MTGFENTVKRYNDRLKKDLSLSDVQACGIWGNIGGETGGLTLLQEVNPTVKGSRGGLDWLQWTGPRRRAYEAWAKDKGLKTGQDETSYQYLVYESKNLETHSIDQLRKTTTVEAATETFMKLNLRPGIPHLEGRIVWAKKAINALNDTKSTIVKKDPVVVVSSAKPSQSAPAATTGGIFGIITCFFASMFTDNLPLIIGVAVGSLVIGYVIHKLIQYRRLKP